MSDNRKIRRRQRCPECGSLDIIKWGVRNGIRRLKCRNCKSLFSARRKDISKSNRFPWFRKWVSGRMTIEEISGASGYSSRQLHRWFDEYLDEYPTWTIKTTTPIYLLIDGTYYSDNHCLIVYRAENIRRTLFYRFTRAEDDDEIASDLLNIRSMGYDVIGITTDGGDNIVRAVEYVYPDVPRQRCVVHVQRECLNSITLHPRSAEARLVKRKKTHRTAEVPITPIVRSIIDKYKGISKFGYIFPIMDDEQEKNHSTKDYTYKKFREHLNIWLKEIGKELGTDFDLYAYVFRHTAITVAINNGLPISYIANAAGTSVEMIQQHYYNGECAKNREMLTSVFMRAGV